MTSLLEVAGERALIAPLVLDPMSALLAEKAGFEALYLGGGALGYQRAVTEANLSLTEMVQLALDIRAVTKLPLILDGVCGWGNAVHMGRTVRLAEAAGFCAIEIEDQVLPKRVHHHVGQDQVISCEEMVFKVEAAVQAKTTADFLVIARTNASRVHGFEEAVRRAKAYRKAGADVILALHSTPAEAKALAEAVGPPLMLISYPGGINGLPMPLTDLAQLGYRIVVDPTTPLAAMYQALKSCYAAIRATSSTAAGGVDACRRVESEIHELIGLPRMLELERKSSLP